MNAPYNVTVEYRKPIKNGHTAKVIFHDLGMYIDGWRIMAVDNNDSGWWFQPPARSFAGRFIPVIEFDRKNEFWIWLEAQAVELAKEHSGEVPEPRINLDQSAIDRKVAKAMDSIAEGGASR